MPNMFTLRKMWQDALTRKGLKVTDLDADTQALVAEFNTKEADFNTKATTWETAKTTMETTQKDLLNSRGDLMSLDSRIHQAIAMIRDTASPAAPVNP